MGGRGRGGERVGPGHCVQGTRGAELHGGLRTEADEGLVHEGTEGRIDSYSAFYDNAKFKQTALLGELRDASSAATVLSASEWLPSVPRLTRCC